MMHSQRSWHSSQNRRPTGNESEATEKNMLGIIVKMNHVIIRNTRLSLSQIAVWLWNFIFHKFTLKKQMNDGYRLPTQRNMSKNYWKPSTAAVGWMIAEWREDNLRACQIYLRTKLLPGWLFSRLFHPTLPSWKVWLNNYPYPFNKYKYYHVL